MDQQIIQFIINELHDGRADLEIDSSEDLLSSGLVESMGMMRMIQFLEETFEVKVPPQDMTIENFITVDAMVDYMNRLKV